MDVLLGRERIRRSKIIKQAVILKISLTDLRGHPLPEEM
jgi:hypothetical protein